MLDDEQEETLRAYVDPVSKFFEVVLCFHIIVAFFYYNVELHFQKEKLLFHLQRVRAGGGGEYAVLCKSWKLAFSILFLCLSYFSVTVTTPVWRLLEV